MNILLVSMPDSFEHMPTVGIRMPNGALSSLAGNVDPHHRVAVADLVLVQREVRATLERLVRDHQPDLVGLSIMTFQRKTALRIVELLRALRPDVRVAVGGYDPSLAPEAYTDGPAPVDFIVRGEGELTFRELVRALERGSGLDGVAGLSYRAGGTFHHNPDRPVHGLADGEIRPPNRDARVLQGYEFLGRPVDVVETSRGCTFDCSFCSIIEMRGRNFHTFTFDRVLADLRDAREHGARAIFLVDDNITLNVRRFEALCQAIIDARLDDIDYLVQAMTSAIAAHGATLAPLMRRAGFRYVFLGIENILDDDLRFLRARAKNALRGSGQGDRVPSLAGGALDEGPAHARRREGQSALRSPELADHAGAHVPRRKLSEGAARARGRARRLRAVSRHPKARARVRVRAALGGVLVFAVSGLGAGFGWAGSFTIEPGQSALVVQVFKDGVAARLAHDHVVQARAFSGSVAYDPQKPDASSI